MRRTWIPAALGNIRWNSYLCYCMNLFTHILSALVAIPLAYSCVPITPDTPDKTEQEQTGTTDNNGDQTQTTEATKMYITIDGQKQTVTLADTKAAEELAAKLKDGPVTVKLSDNGGFEI